jgi:surface protein
MATSADYINQLKIDKQTLVNNLVAKGVTATNDETFTSLVPKVANIQGGGTYAPEYISFYKFSGTDISENLEGLNTSNITNMSYMFSSCSKLTSIDISNFDTSNVTNMSNMFNGCSSLVTLNLGNIDTSNVTNMNSMFSSCTKIKKIPQINTSNVTNMYGMFNNSASIEKIPELDGSRVITVERLINIQNTKLTDFGGIKNLGKNYSITISPQYTNYTLNLNMCPNLTEQSLINVLTKLYDIATKGCQIQKVNLGSTNLAKLTSEEGQAALTQAQNYGWTVV